MSVISVKMFNGCKKTFSFFNISVINQHELKIRIDAFVQSRKNINLQVSERNVKARRDIFQSSSYELFFLPSVRAGQSQIGQIPSGELCALLSETSNCFSLCFIPKETAQKSRYKNNMFSSKKYPKIASKALIYFMSNRLCSFLTYENGMIIPSSDGSFLLKGLSIRLLAKQDVVRALLLEKKQENLSGPEHPLVQVPFTNVTSKFIRITCCSAEFGFSFSVKLPLLTEAALQQEINKVCVERAHALKKDELSVYLATKSLYLLINENDPSCNLCLPSCMKMNFESGLLENGDIFCSCFNFETGKNNIFTILILPSEFRKGGNTPDNHYNRRSFPLWQTDRRPLSQKFISLQYLCLFRNENCKLVSHSEMEYTIDGLEIRLISTEQNAFLGLFLSRQKKEKPLPSFSSFRTPRKRSLKSSQSSLLLPSFSSSFRPPRKKSLKSSQSSLVLSSFSSSCRPSKKRSLKSSQSSLALPYAPLVFDPQSSVPQTSILNPRTGTPWSMNLPYTQSSAVQNSSWTATDPQAGPPQGTIGTPYTQSALQAFHPQPSFLMPSMWNFPADPSQSPMGMPSAQSIGSYGPFPSQTSASWWDPQADPSQSPMGMPSAQSIGSYGPFPSQTSASWWDPQADPSHGPIGMPSAQPTGSDGPFLSQTSASWWDPQAGPFQGPIGMSSAQPTCSYESFPSQTSASWLDPQADPSQGPMGMPFAQPTSFYGPSSSSQHTSWMAANLQADPSQGPMGMPFAQPTAFYGPSSSSQHTSWMAANLQAGSSQGTMGMSYTQSASHTQSSPLKGRIEGLPPQGAMELSAFGGNKLENFIPQELHLDELQDILREEKNDDYSQSESD